MSALNPVTQIPISGPINNAQIQMKPNNTAGLYRHEIGHAIGMMHPDGYFSIPKPSVMGAEGNISAWDRYAGAVLYYRPMGSTTPDTDPSGNYVNSFIGGTFPRLGSGSTEWKVLSPEEMIRLREEGKLLPLAVRRPPIP